MAPFTGAIFFRRYRSGQKGSGTPRQLPWLCLKQRPSEHCIAHLIVEKGMPCPRGHRIGHSDQRIANPNHQTKCDYGCNKFDHRTFLSPEALLVPIKRCFLDLIRDRTRPSTTESGAFAIRPSFRTIAVRPHPMWFAILVTVHFSIQRSLASSPRSRLSLAHFMAYLLNTLKAPACSRSLAQPSPVFGIIAL